MQRTLAGVVLIVVGAGLVAVGFDRVPDRAETLRRHGATVTATVVGVSGGTVELTYAIRGQGYRGRAYPEDPGPFAVGDGVLVSVLLSDPERALIDGTEEAESLGYLWWMVAGLLAALAGLAMVLLRLVARPVSGRLPPEDWVQERHGGA